MVLDRSDLTKECERSDTGAKYLASTSSLPPQTSHVLHMRHKKALMYINI
jgi:hypothetical protein